MNPVIISAPFGNYPRLLNFNHVTYTIGTYTWEARGSADKPYGSKWWRFLKTVRYSHTFKAWVNQMGLKNPGIQWLARKCYTDKTNLEGKIISIFGFEAYEWRQAIHLAVQMKPLAIEINASCPNVDKPPFESTVLDIAVNTKIPVIVKLPPIYFLETAQMAYEAGVRVFHACNTLPTIYGGLSGKPLIKISQQVVRDIRKVYPDVTIIGGGGITTAQDARDYLDAGANRVAIGTMLFNPLRWRRVKDIANVVIKAQNWSGVLKWKPEAQPILPVAK